MKLSVRALTLGLVGVVWMVLTLSACGRFAEEPTVPAINESGLERGRRVDPPVETPPEAPDHTPVSPRVGTALSGTSYEVEQPTTIRYRKDKVLEFKVEVPTGTVINVPDNYQMSVLDYRKSDGSTERSSTGFVTPIKIVSVPKAHAANFPASRLESINATEGGLYVTAAVIGQMQGIEGDFAVLKAATPGAGFLANYEASGKPKFNYTKSVVKRFGERLNKGVSTSSMSAAERTKWSKIFKELRRAAIRTVESPKSLIMIDREQAIEESIRFEKYGIVPLNGAWTIATQATAPRHDFGNVPCAETMSEFVREAYARAGYKVTDDFSDKKGNPLIWSHSAAVVNFSLALYQAGWIAWDSTVYRPITGSLLMNGAGYTPGHTYISAGDDGRFIVDNGAPQGRDLRVTSEKTIKMMYQTGVFFLPPGVNPPKW